MLQRHNARVHPRAQISLPRLLLVKPPAPVDALTYAACVGHTPMQAALHHPLKLVFGLVVFLRDGFEYGFVDGGVVGLMGLAEVGDLGKAGH